MRLLRLPVLPNTLSCMAKVLIILGSKSDMEFAETCAKQLEELGIGSVIEVSSAHRHPERTGKLTSGAEANGFDAIVAMADGHITHFGPAAEVAPLLPAGLEVRSVGAFTSPVVTPRLAIL